MLRDTVDGVFAELGDTATLSKSWPQIDELGLPALLLPEDEGGFGGTWQDALIVFRLTGFHVLALPVAEAAIAAWLAAGTGLEGRGTIAGHADGKISAERFTGTVRGAVMSEGATFIAAPAPDGGTLLLASADGAISGNSRTRCFTAHRPMFSNSAPSRGLRKSRACWIPLWPCQ